MPSTVTRLFESVGLSVGGCVQWKTPIPVRASGVYVVSISDDPSRGNGLLRRAPVDPSAVGAWLGRVPSLRIDGAKCVGADELCHRLASFWLSDENIVYIGKATSLRSRVGDYYRTPLGEPRPHAGGHWVKTLSCLPILRVYFRETSAYEAAEQSLLGAFMQGASNTARKSILDPSLPIPFANLEFPAGIRKKHGISGSKLSRGHPAQ